MAAPAFHCAAVTDRNAFLRMTLGVDDQGVEEVFEQLRQAPAETASEIFFKPFDTTQKAAFPQSRFSDGTWPVRYTACELNTAIREVQDGRLRKLRIHDVTNATLQLSYIECDFSGSVKDLRPESEKWPFLTSDDGYYECNRIARVARSERLHGLLTPSARLNGGTCLPIFRRDGASRPRIVGSGEYTYDAARGQWREARGGRA